MTLSSDRAFSSPSRPLPSRPASIPIRTSVAPRGVEHGMGFAPSARLAQRFVRPEPGRRIIAAQAPAPAARVSAPEFRRPFLFGLFLLGPGARQLRDLIKGSAPYVDDDSKDLIHWILLGNPRHSGPEFLDYLDSRGLPLSNLREEWDAAVSARADEECVVAFETAKLAKALGIHESKMPVLLIIPNGSNKSPIELQLPKEAAWSPEVGSVMWSTVRKHLSSQRILAFVNELDAVTPERLYQALAEPVSRLAIHLRARFAESLGLDPTDERILHVLLKADPKRQLTGQIAAALGRDPKSIGKNLSKLTKLKLLDNRRRHGYVLTPKGRQVAEGRTARTERPGG